MNEYLLQVNNRLESLEVLLKQQITLSKEVFNAEEACLFLGITKNHLYKLTSEGQIPHSKPGGRKLFFDRKKLFEWAMSNQVLTQVQIDDIAIENILIKKISSN